VVDQGDKPFGIDFVDPLFAVAIHIGFTHGILEEPWFKEWRFPSGTEVFDVWVLALVLWTIILSWVGYHESIKTKPLKGMGRFVVDVLLVGSYAVLLVKYRNIDAILQLLVWIYFLFIVWDGFKVWEWHDKYQGQTWQEKYRRELVTVLWFAVFLALLILRSKWQVTPTATLVGMWVATIAYRVNKGVPMWTALWHAVSKRVRGDG